MDSRQIVKHVQANIMAGNAIKIESDPGMGKSAITGGKIALWYRDWVKAGKPDARVGLAITFLAVANPISATGLPWKSERTWTHPATAEQATYTVTDPAIPQWAMARCLDTGVFMPACMFDAVLLIIDEWGQGSAEAKRAHAELLLHGGIGQHQLPPGSARIALANFDSRDGVTKEFDFVNNRVIMLRMNGSQKIWHEDWADRPYIWQGREWQMMGVSKVWAQNNPDALFEKKPEKQGAWCTPRSFAAEDRYVQSIIQLEGEIPLDDPAFVEGCAGHCGMAHAQSYIGTLKYKLELPPHEDIVRDPLNTPVPTKADLQMLLAYELGGNTTPDELAPVIQYLGKRDGKGHGMPRDMQVTFITTLIKRGAKQFLNRPAMMEWLAKNGHLMAIIHSIT
jgi:hypothetical protein